MTTVKSKLVLGKVPALSKADIKSALMDDKSDANMQILDQALSARQLDILFESITELNKEDKTFILGECLMKRLKLEFALMGEKTVYGMVKLWIENLKTSQEGIRNHSVLVASVVYSVNVLQSTELRQMLKQELPEVHSKLLLNKQYQGESTLICRCLFYILVLEESYLDGVTSQQVNLTWNRILDSKASWKSPTVMLCSHLLNPQENTYLDKLTEKEQRMYGLTEDIGDPIVCPKRQFFAMLLSNIHTVFANCSREQGSVLMKALVDFYAQRQELEIVTKTVFNSLHAANANASLLSEQFFYRILNVISDSIRRFARNLKDMRDSKDMRDAKDMRDSKDTRDSNDGISEDMTVEDGITEEEMDIMMNGLAHSISKMSKMLSVNTSDNIEDTTSSKSPEQIWTKAMTKYLDRTFKESFSMGMSDEDDVVNMMKLLILTEDEINSLPKSVGAALLGVIFMLSVTFERCEFAGTISELFRWNGAYCREMLASCGTKMSKLFSKFASDRYLDNDKNVHNILVEYLCAGDDAILIVDKCKNLLEGCYHETNWNYLIRSQLLAAITSAISRIDAGILMENSKCVTDFMEDSVTKLLVKQWDFILSNCMASSKIICEGNLISHDELRIFVSVLNSLREMQQIERLLKADFNLTPTLNSTIQACDTICCDRKRLKSLIIKEELFDAIVALLSSQGKRSCVLNWKCLTAVMPHCRCVIENILMEANVEEVQKMLKSSLKGSEEKCVMEILTMVCSLPNEKKRKAVLDIIKQIPMMILNVVQTHPETTLKFIISLLSLVGGTKHEREIVTLSMSILSVSFPVLTNTEVKDHDAEVLVLISTTLLESLQHCASSVCDDQCALFTQLLVRCIKSVERYALSKSCDSELMIRNNHGLSAVAHAMAAHKPHFARIAPLILSECVTGKHTPLVVHKLLELCDKYSIALLSSNLPSNNKRHFANTYQQFYKANQLSF